MKKLLLISFLLCFAILSSCAPKKENLTGEVTVPKPLKENIFRDNLKLVKLDSSSLISSEDIHSLGFSRCIIETPGVRNDNGNFKTDFKVKKNLQRSINILEESDLAYYVEITSGPGISKDRKNLSLYTNPDNIVFFTQMIKETIEINKENPHFNGIILNIGHKNIKDNVYYKTLNEITSRVLKDYDLPIFITLNNDFFINENSSLPVNDFDNPNIGYNIDMDFKCKSYPGKAKFNDSDVDLSKNYVLDKLANIKNANKDNKQFLISIRSPWEDGCDVLIKDVFEIMKTLGFEFALSYSNTNNEYDFTKNQDIVNILSKY